MLPRVAISRLVLGSWTASLAVSLARAATKQVYLLPENFLVLPSKTAQCNPLLVGGWRAALGCELLYCLLFSLTQYVVCCLGLPLQFDGDSKKDIGTELKGFSWPSLHLPHQLLSLSLHCCITDIPQILMELHSASPLLEISNYLLNLDKQCWL